MKNNDFDVTTNFYGEDPTSDPKQTFGKEQLPKNCKCYVKELRLNQTNLIQFQNILTFL